jgi:hypothetical protein
MMLHWQSLLTSLKRSQKSAQRGFNDAELNGPTIWGLESENLRGKFLRL